MRRSALFISATLGICSTTLAASPGGQPATRYEQVTGRNNPAATFFGGSQALAYAPPNRTTAPAPVAASTRPLAKPHSGVQQAGGVSPYLGLDARESDTSLPNYYMFVQKQLEQQRNSQVHQAQYRRLQHQVRGVTSGGAASNLNGGIPTTGASDQFMNVGDYYPGLK